MVVTRCLVSPEASSAGGGGGGGGSGRGRGSGDGGGGSGRALQDSKVVLGTRADVLFGIGEAVAALLPAIPGGALVFFTGKEAMQLAMKIWKRGAQRGGGTAGEEGKGTWAKLVAAVGGDEQRLHVDDSGSAEGSAATVRGYRAHTGEGPVAAAGGASSSSSSCSAVLFAVLRGRSSEGADFSDATCRAVFIIGAGARWSHARLRVCSPLAAAHDRA